MKRLPKSGLLLSVAFAALTMSATFDSASARLLACPCDGGRNCRLEHGREQSNYTYDPTNMGAAYDAIEQNAMQQADAQALAKANAAMAADAGMRCANPCDPTPELSVLHGPPFAGGMNGNGMARSLWEVHYVCKRKRPPPPPPPNFSPVNPGANEGGHQPPDGGGALHGPNVALPVVPKCFGLPVDKDETLDELHRMRTEQAHDLGPLGTDKDDPEFLDWRAQHNANLDAIDAAIKQAEETPVCPPHRSHSSILDHVQIGIGIGVGGHDHHDHDHYNDHNRHDDKHDDKHDAKHGDSDHHTSHDDHRKTDTPQDQKSDRDDRR